MNLLQSKYRQGGSLLRFTPLKGSFLFKAQEKSAYKEYNPLVNLSKVLLPPLHIKLGFVKRYVKALNRDCFKHIQQMFPHISDMKLKEGIFNGPEIRKMLSDEIFKKEQN